MAEFELNAIILLAIFFLIWGIFLFFDVFHRNEKYGYLAYIIATLPVNYLWLLGFDVLGVYMVLVILWNICMIRDLIGVIRKNRDLDDQILFLLLGILIQVIVAAIIPANQVRPDLQKNTFQLWVFYFPDLYTDTFEVESWVNSTYLLGFRGGVTFLILLAIIPLILEVKGEEVNFLAILIIDALFVPAFLYLTYIWAPLAMGVLTLLLFVILLIVLLVITRSGKEMK
ncbi:MAG: hypothetical protein ACTSXH_09730 [Promethearchaeota archaeon]